ncbi:MAG: hypothetical protein JWQ09_1133 [Segetibacter sp.]|nr:hypothetical protein [Segetibacter sp.]
MSFFGGILKGIGKGAKAVGKVAGGAVGGVIGVNPYDVLDKAFTKDKSSYVAPVTVPVSTTALVPGTQQVGILGVLSNFVNGLNPHITVDTQLSDEGKSQSKSLLLWIIGGVVLIMFMGGRRR